MKKRLVSWLLALTAVLTCLTPASAVSTGGTFYLAASTADRTLIEPAPVSYTAGQTVLQALREGKFPKSRHESYVRLYNELKDLKAWDRK